MWQGFVGWIVAWVCAASMLTELLQALSHRSRWCGLSADDDHRRPGTTGAAVRAAGGMRGPGLMGPSRCRFVGRYRSASRRVGDHTKENAVSYLDNRI